MLGDAAHAMTPDLGQGAGQAFEDAATLAALFDGLSPSAVPTALARYDAVRGPRTRSLQRSARQAHRLLGLRGAAAHLRDIAFRLIPGSLAARAMSAQLRFAAPSPLGASETPVRCGGEGWRSVSARTSGRRRARRTRCRAGAGGRSSSSGR